MNSKISEFWKDKKINWWIWFFEGIAQRWYCDQHPALWKLCIDEKDIQWQVYTILTNATCGHLIGLYPWVKAHEVVSFFKKNTTLERRTSIDEICCDMSHTMESIIVQLFPNAQIVSDRFHVMKNVLDDIWAIRTRAKTAIKKRVNQEQKNHEKELCQLKIEWKINNTWRGRPTTKIISQRHINWETDIDIATRLTWQIRKRRVDRNTNQVKRREIAHAIPELSDLIVWYEYMHKLRDIYDSDETKESAQQKITERLTEWSRFCWKIDEIENLMNTIINRFESITNYFISHHSNGFAEWLHSRIQRLISMSRGFVNRDYMIYRIIKLWTTRNASTRF
jgi:transposase